VAAMQTIREQTVRGRASGQSFQDLDISGCIFDGCYVPRQSLPGAWTVIRNVVLRDATNINCSINTAMFDEVALHNLKRHGEGPLFLWCCVFRHVTLSGKISGIKFNRAVAVGEITGEVHQDVWDARVEEFYGSVDWALDITEAKFGGGVSFEAIPGDKVRRNPETQVLVRRERLTQADWRALDFGNSAFDISLSWFLSDSLFDSVVLAARTASRESKGDLVVLDMLRNEGIAE